MLYNICKCRKEVGAKVRPVAAAAAVSAAVAVVAVLVLECETFGASVTRGGVLLVRMGLQQALLLLM